MTIEKAIQLLHRLQDEQFDSIHGDERREALEMAVRALESNLVKESDGLVNDLVKDCISRQQAIGALNDEYHGMISDESMKIYQIINWISALPSAQPHWIPCSEGLPGVNGSYLVTVHPNYIVPGGIHVDMLSWFNGKWWFDLDGQDAEFPDPIIAWMPLPEPYGGENDES